MPGNLIFGVVALLLWLFSVGAYADEQDLSESHEFFRVVIDGKPYRLEGFVVERTDAAAPLPIRSLLMDSLGRFAK